MHNRLKRQAEYFALETEYSKLITRLYFSTPNYMAAKSMAFAFLLLSKCFYTRLNCLLVYPN